MDTSDLNSYTEKELRSMCMEYLEIHRKVYDYIFDEYKTDAVCISGNIIDFLITSHRNLNKKNGTQI